MCNMWKRYFRLFRVIPGYSSLFQVIQRHIPGYSRLFQVIPGFSRLFQAFPGYSSLFQVIPAFSRLFQLIPGFTASPCLGSKSFLRGKIYFFLNLCILQSYIIALHDKTRINKIKVDEDEKEKFKEKVGLDLLWPPQLNM